MTTRRTDAPPADEPLSRHDDRQPTQRMLNRNVRVRFTRDGRVAHPSLPREDQVEARVGDEIVVDEEWASVLVTAGRAELVEDEE